MAERRQAGNAWQFSFRAHVIALVIAAALPLAGLGFYSIARLADAGRELDRDQILGTARAVSASVDQYLLSARRTLRALATTLPETGPLDDFYEECAALAREHGGTIMLADRSGQEIFTTRRPLGAPLPHVVGTRDFWQAIKDGVPRIGNLFLPSIDKQPSFSVLVPITRHDEVTQILVMSFPVEALGRLLSAQQLPADWTTGIVDGEGRIMTGGSGVAGRSASPQVARLSAESNEGFFQLTNVHGTPVFLGAVRSPLSGWKTVVGLPQTAVAGPLEHTIERFVLLGGIALLAAIAAAALIGRHLASDLAGLARAAAALGAREPIPASASTVREMNQVAAALDRAGSERAQVEEDLRRSREHLALAQRVSGVGSVLHDIKADIDEWSDELYRIIGVEHGARPESMATFLELLAPEDRQRLIATRLALLQGDYPPAQQYRFRRPDGEARVVRVEVEPLFDGNGPPSRAIITIHNVTELSAAEERLRRNQQHLAVAQRIAHTGSVMHDIRSGADEWSDELYDILGLQRGAAPETFEAFLERVHPDDRAGVAERQAALARGEQRPVSEYRIVRPDGGVRTIQSEIAPLSSPAGGAPSRIVVTFRDVTELRAAETRQQELERQLQHAQKVEALGTLAGGIAHDLNNALVPVLGLAKLTMKRLPEASRERANLATILKAGERARDLVRRILAFSRKDAPHRQPVDLAALVRESLQMARASMPATIQLDEAIEPVPPVLGDAGELQQVVMNLVVNALQAIGERMGKVAVGLKAEPQTLPDGASSDHIVPALHLWVRDSGCGMDEATRQRVFEPFFTTKPVGEGTGLGLSVVHGIIVQHGGRIAVDSSLGQGTCFDVFLPAAGGDAAERHPEAA
jgi:PAS domain S-box-containing protein